MLGSGPVEIARTHNLNNDRHFVILFIGQNDDEEPNTFQYNVVSDSLLQPLIIEKCLFLSNYMMAKAHHHTLQ